MWWDSAASHVTKFAEKLSRWIDIGVIIDNDTLYLDRVKDPGKYLALWAPQDPKVYFDSQEARNIDISFAGSVHGMASRQNYISRLGSCGLQFHKAGGQREKNLSLGDYANIYRDSKMTVNFCYNSKNFPQLKGRVIEATHCGALLLEEDNPLTARKFKPMEEYVPFKDADDLIKKAKYFLANEDELRSIARKGQLRSVSDYGADKFWSTIFKKAFKDKFKLETRVATHR